MSWRCATWAVLACLGLTACLFREAEDPAGYPEPRPARPVPEPQPPTSRVPIEPAPHDGDEEAEALARPRDGGTEGPLTVPPVPDVPLLPGQDGGTRRR